MSLLALAIALPSVPASAEQKLCNAATSPELQACIDAANPADTTTIRLTATNYPGRQIVVRNKQNITILGNPAATEATRPTITYKDTLHRNVNEINDVSVAYDRNGAMIIDESRNITVDGIAFNGLTIWAYQAQYWDLIDPELGDWKGNVGLGIRNSWEVTVRNSSMRNCWYGLQIRGRNLGGAFSYPNPHDNPDDVAGNLPTSNAGQFGRHLVERNRLYDNTWGIIFESDWDLGSVIRYNLFYDNYIRALTVPKWNGQMVNVLTADQWNTVGGAMFMNDIAITPYRIHNNTFLRNGVTVGGYYKVGTQHLFYNNLIGRPRNFYNVSNLSGPYPQTERQTELVQYYSEHQRSNIFVPQDGVSPTPTEPIRQLRGGTSNQLANFRLYRLRATRRWENAPFSAQWRGQPKSWDLSASERDSLFLTYVAAEPAGATIQALSDTGGVIAKIRHNMWAGSAVDPEDAADGTYGQPWLPLNITANMANKRVFRDVTKFGLRWTNTIPFLDTSALASLRGTANFLRPNPTSTFTSLRIKSKGQPDYGALSGQEPDIGALSATSTTGYADEQPRLILLDTLIPYLRTDTIGFPLHLVAENGLDPAKIKNLRVHRTKFYRYVPIADTIYSSVRVQDGGDGITRKNSILSEVPWPDTVTLTPFAFVNQELQDSGLKADHYFAGRFAGGPLDDSTFFARAEVILQAEYEGKTIYSNPAVFMYSRPRFRLQVDVYDANMKPLPLASDGFSSQVIAGQPLKLVVKPITLGLTNFKNLQIGRTHLMGADTSRLERLTPTLSKLHPNSILQPKFTSADQLVFDIRALQAGTNDAITMRGLFDVTDVRVIQGNSQRLKVIASRVYQATIDSVQYDTAMTRPSLTKKLNSLTRDSAGNTTTMPKASLVGARVFVQLRDSLGNPIIDSAASLADLRIRLRHVAVPLPAPISRYGISLSGALLIGGKGDSLLSIDSTGRVVFDMILPVGSKAPSGSMNPLVSEVVTSTNAPIAGRNVIPDTTWILIAPGSVGIRWVDTTGTKPVANVNMPVGDWFPVRIEAIDGGVRLNASTVITLPSVPGKVEFYRTPASTTPLTQDTLVSGLSKILWMRALDSTSGTGVALTAVAPPTLEDASTTMRGLFAYPKVKQLIYRDADCDGRPDQVRATFASPVLFRPLGFTIYGDSLQATFPGQHLLPWIATRTGENGSNLQLDTVLILSWNDELAAAGAMPTINRLWLYNPLINAKVELSPLPLLEDKAPPIALSGTVSQGYQGTNALDIVTVRFSEDINLLRHPMGSSFPFDVRRNGSTVDLSGAKLGVAAASAGTPGEFTFTLLNMPTLLRTGDSLVIRDTAFADVAGNRSGVSCPNLPFATTFSPRLEPIDAVIWDETEDGNADHIRIWFKDTLVSVPEELVVRWGTEPTEEAIFAKADLSRLGVAPGQSVITLPLSGWAGMRTIGPADTAYFNKGAAQVRIRDSIPPILIKATINYDRTDRNPPIDTLRLMFSEPIAGCAAGMLPSECFEIRDANGPLAFPAGSKVESVNGIWITVSVPGDGSIGAGTEIRPEPKDDGGKVVDGQTQPNAPGPRTPWRVIEGDPRPPLHGRYLDANGDGRIESVVLTFLKKPTARQNFEFVWPNANGKPETRRSDLWTVASPDSLRWTIKLDSTFAYGVTGYDPAATTALGTQLPQASGIRYTFPVRDSAGAVLLEPATLEAGASNGNDVIYLMPSERIDLTDPAVLRLAEFRRDSVVMPASDVKIVSATHLNGHAWSLVISATSSYRPQPGDWIRLSTSGSVADTTTQGATPHPQHAWIRLVGKPRIPTLAYYTDANADGRIDRLVMRFEVAPSKGTRIKALDPAGSGEARIDTLDKADTSTRVVFDLAPWGQNVTSLVAGKLGRIFSSMGDSVDFVVVDSADPVIVSANMGYSKDSTIWDTLRLVFSEPVKYSNPNDKSPFRFKIPGSQETTGLGFGNRNLEWDEANNTTMVLYLSPSDAVRPEVKDSLRISPAGEISDLLGGYPEGRGKFTVIKGGSRPPLTTSKISNPVVTPSQENLHKPPFQAVTRRPPTSGSDPSKGVWSPIPGTKMPTIGSGVSHTWDPDDVADYANGGKYGTVFSLITNRPGTLTVIIYDNLGVFVNTFELEITPKMLEKAEKNSLNQAEFGALWHGKTQAETMASGGVYNARMIVSRAPDPSEVEQGMTLPEVTNVIYRVGIYDSNR